MALNLVARPHLPAYVQRVVGLPHRAGPVAQFRYRMLWLLAAHAEVSVGFPHLEERRLGESCLAVRIGVPWAATRGLLAPLVKTVPLSCTMHTSHLPGCSPGPCFLPAIHVPLGSLEVPD